MLSQLIPLELLDVRRLEGTPEERHRRKFVQRRLQVGH